MPIVTQAIQFDNFPIVDELERLMRKLEQIAFDLLELVRASGVDRVLQASDEVLRSPVTLVSQLPYLAR